MNRGTKFNIFSLNISAFLTYLFKLKLVNSRKFIIKDQGVSKRGKGNIESPITFFLTEEALMVT